MRLLRKPECLLILKIKQLVGQSPEDLITIRIGPKAQLFLQRVNFCVVLGN